MVTRDLTFRTVPLAAIELDRHAVLRPEAVDLEATDPDVDLRPRQPAGLDKEEELTLDRAVGARQVRPMDGEGFAELPRPALSASGDRVNCIEIDQPVVIGLGQDVADIFKARVRRVIEERLRDRGDGEAVVPDALHCPPPVDLDPWLGTASPGGTDMNQRRPAARQPPPPSGRLMTEHRAGAC